MRIQTVLGKTITVADGVSFVAANKDWDRQFIVVSRERVGEIDVFRCCFAHHVPSPNGERFAFVGFVVAHGFGFTEAVPVIGAPGWADADISAVGEIERHKCLECGRHVEFRTKSKRLGPECIRITITCSACGHSEVDILD